MIECKSHNNKTNNFPKCIAGQILYLYNFNLNSFDTDSKLRHDTIGLSRTKHTDKTHVRLTSGNKIHPQMNLCALEEDTLKMSTF